MNNGIIVLLNVSNIGAIPLIDPLFLRIDTSGILTILGSPLFQHYHNKYRSSKL